MKKVDERTFGRFLSIIVRHGQMYLDRELRPFHIRAGQIPILRFLGIQDGVSQESIRKYFHLDKGTIAKTIRPLIKEGYVTREVSAEDRRAYQVFLTGKGRDIIPELKSAVEKWTEIITTDLSAVEKETVYHLLSRMSDNAHAYFVNHRIGKNGKG